MRATDRDEAEAIRAYLEALEAQKRRPGRRKSVESLQRQLTGVRLRIIHADPLTRAKLAQERIELEAELAARTSDITARLSELEAGFVEYVAAFSARQRISYEAWKTAGVPVAVLRKAGLRPG